MSLELIAMLGGGVSGFVMKMIAAQAEAQSRNFEMMIQKQVAADQSANEAAQRGGVWVRRIFVGFILFAVILAPFILSLTSTPVTVEKEGLGGFFQIDWIGRRRLGIIRRIRFASRSQTSNACNRWILLWQFSS